MDEAYIDAVEAFASISRAERGHRPPVYTLTEPVQLILDEPSYSLPTHLEPLSVQLTEPSSMNGHSPLPSPMPPPDKAVDT